MEQRISRQNTTSTNSANVSPSTWANSPRTSEPSRSEPQSAPPNPPSPKSFPSFLFTVHLFSPLLQLSYYFTYVVLSDFYFAFYYVMICFVEAAARYQPAAPSLSKTRSKNLFLAV